MTIQPNILIVDDSPTIVAALRRILAPIASIHVASNGESALKIANELPPDLILLDVEMPGIDGYQVCRILKATPRLAEVPVIFVTAHREVEHEVAGLEAGAVDFIPKPMHDLIVLARVKTHLTLKRQSDLLRNLASHDALTGLHNRRAFDQNFEQECRRHQRNAIPLGLVMLDIDHFKAFNDHYGHPMGDACIASIARVLKDCVRRPGEMVARYGGEEFVVLLPGSNAIASAQFAQHLCEAVREIAMRHEASSTADIVTVSVGAASGTPTGRKSGSHLMAVADKALYRAKAEGRNRMCVATRVDMIAVLEDLRIAQEPHSKGIATPTTPQA